MWGTEIFLAVVPVVVLSLLKVHNSLASFNSVALVSLPNAWPNGSDEAGGGSTNGLLYVAENIIVVWDNCTGDMHYRPWRWMMCKGMWDKALTEN